MGEIVGFVGLGAMGLGMAANLVAAGHRVLGHDPDPARADAARAKGIEVVPSPRDAAAGATRTVVSAVRTAEQTRAVLLGADGIAAAGVPRTVVVVSTLDPTTMRTLAADAADHDLAAVDITMSGGPWGAEAGTLTLIVSGPSEVVDPLQPLLDAMGSNIFRVGDEVGVAQSVKLAVQLAFGVNMMGVFEALQVVADAGVPEEQLMDVLRVSVGGSWVVENWARVKPWWEHYVPGEDLDILLKDLRSVLRESDARTASMPVTALVFQLMRHVWPAREALLGRADPS
jgi:3-hydroxyisobutyrate dehydrogenase-like beta-hydroxyacid dehydrogenase